MKIYIIHIVFFLGISNIGNAQIINEIVSNNTNSLNVNQKYPDWIEIYNPDSTIVNLGYYFLSDDGDQPYKWTFPSIEIQPYGYLIVLADGKDKMDDFIHTNFKLSRKGETLLLSRPDYSIIQSVRFPLLDADVAYARIDTSWRFVIPTPFAKNEENEVTLLLPPEFSYTSGLFAQGINLSVLNPNSQAHIEWFRNDLANYELANDTLQLTVDSSCCICAKTVGLGYRSSRIVCHSYIISDASTLPILSIIGNEKKLFDVKKGMFELGPNAEDRWPYWGANFWEERTEEVFFQLMLDDDVFYAHTDIEMHGGRQSRTNPQKTFRLLAKEKYEQDYFEYPFFRPSHTLTVSKDSLYGMPVATSMPQTVEMVFCKIIW